MSPYLYFTVYSLKIRIFIFHIHSRIIEVRKLKKNYTDLIKYYLFSYQCPFLVQDPIQNHILPLIYFLLKQFLSLSVFHDLDLFCFEELYFFQHYSLIHFKPLRKIKSSKNQCLYIHYPRFISNYILLHMHDFSGYIYVATYFCFLNHLSYFTLKYSNTYYQRSRTFAPIATTQLSSQEI